MEKEIFKKGDKIKINTLVTEVDDVVFEYGETFLVTEYGNFNADLVVKIEEGNNETNRRK